MLLNPILKMRKFSLRITEFFKNIEQVYDKVGFEVKVVGIPPKHFVQTTCPWVQPKYPSGSVCLRAVVTFSLT